MKSSTLKTLLVISLALLLCPALTHTLTGKPDKHGVYPESKRNEIDDDFQKVLDNALSDNDAVHSKDAILRLAYQTMIHEDLDEHLELKARFDSGEGKFTYEDNASMANAVALGGYIDGMFGERVEMGNEEAREMLKQEGFDAWTENMPDSVMEELAVLLKGYEASDADL